MQQKSHRVVMVSGGFDPVHIGHVRMFEEARKLGDELIVVINNDNWLKFKKGFAFMTEDDRKEIIESFRPVDRVVLTSHAPNTDDISVCAELRMIQPDIFANGGDRKSDNIPEYALCEELGIEMVFNVGYGGKIRSSSELVQKQREFSAQK
jgi:cytidyltransferase-like protein